MFIGVRKGDRFSEVRGNGLKWMEVEGYIHCWCWGRGALLMLGKWLKKSDSFSSTLLLALQAFQFNY